MIIPFLTYLLESSICLTVFYTFYRLVLRQEAFFLANRVFILASLILSLLIPAIEVPLLPQPLIYSGILLADMQIVVNEAEKAFSFSAMAHLLYGLPCVYLMIKLFYQIIKLLHFSKIHQSGKASGYQLVLTGGKFSTFSFFRLLFWDNSQILTQEGQVQILQHELVHIRQWHSLDIMFIEVMKAFFWFHPAVYLYKKELQQVHEYLADAAVVQKHNTQAYIQLILSQVFQSSAVSLTNPFSQFQTKNRIIMLHKFKQTKPAFWKIALSLPLILSLILVYSCDTDTAEELIPAQTKDNSSEKKSAQDEQVFMVVEKMPEPTGGIGQLMQYLGENIKYPAEARQKGTEGKVFVQFIINKDGSIGDVQVMKGIGNGCDAEAVRVVKAMPTWKPGLQNGEAVNVRMSLPIMFKLN